MKKTVLLLTKSIWKTSIIGILMMISILAFNPFQTKAQYDEFSWVDDYVPPCATETGSAWDWTSLTGTTYIKFGKRCHTDASATGYHYHRFTGANTTQTMTISPSDSLFLWVYPRSGANQTSEIMIEWYGSSTWYRAYWKATSGTGTGLTGAYYAGTLPSTSTYSKIRVKASDIGISSTITLDGMGFGCVNGQVAFERAGKIISDGSGAGLTADFYDNAPNGDAMDMYIGTRTFANWPTNINWWYLGGGADSSPDDISGNGCNKLGMGTDNWGIMLSGYYKAPTTGTYSFRVSHDDGARIYIMDDNQTTGSPWAYADWLTGGTRNTGTKVAQNLTGGQFYGIVVEFYNATGGSGFHGLQYTTDGTNWFDIPVGSLYTYTYPAIAPGLKASYYTGNFATLTATNFSESTSTDINRGANSAAFLAGNNATDNWSAKWSGYLVPTCTGTYTIYMQHDDDASISFDGTPFLSSTGYGHEESATKTLTAGQSYKMDFQVWDNTGNGLIQIQWESSTCGITKQPIAYNPYLWTNPPVSSTAPTTISGTNVICTSGNSVTLTASGGTDGTSSNLNWYSGSCGPIFNQEWFIQPYSTYQTTVNSLNNGVLEVYSFGGDPNLTMTPIGSWDPSVYKYIQIRYRVISGTAGATEIFFTNTRSSGAIGDQAVSAALTGGGAWQILNIDMSTNAYWNPTYGNITGWRFDYTNQSGTTIQFDYIGLGSSLAIGQGSSVTVSPTATTTYYVLRSGLINTTTCASQAVTLNVRTAGTFAAAQTICNGATPNAFTNTASGTATTGTISYEWQTNASGSYATISGATSSTYQAPALTATTSYRRRTVATGGGATCTSAFTPVRAITVNAAVTAGVIGSPQTICYGTTPALLTSTSDGTGTGTITYEWQTNASGSWVTISGATSSTYQPPALTATTSYQRRTKAVSGATCYSNYATAVTITVNPASTATVGISRICNGGSTTLSASNGTSWAWSSGGCSTSQSCNISPATNTTYTVTITNNSVGCTATTSIAVNATPSITVGATRICNGTSTSLSASSGDSWAWSTGGCGSSQTCNANPTSNTTYTVTVTTGGVGCTATSSISVNATPSIMVGAARICNGSSTTLSASIGDSWNWSTGGCGSSQTCNASPTTSTTYTVTVTTGGVGCTATNSIAVNPTPSATVGTSPICNGSSTTLSASAGDSYNWSSGGCSTSQTCNISPVTTTTYSVTVTTGSVGCTASTSLTVNELPSVTAGGAATICSGNSVNISADGASSYAWSEGIGGGTPKTVNPTTTTTYVVTGTDANTCTNTAQVIITIRGGVTQTTANASDWNTNSTWSSNEVPKSCDDVVIDNNVTINSGVNVVCAALTINNGKALTATTGNLSVTGNFVNNGTFTHNSGTVTFAGTTKVSGSSTTTFNNVINTGVLTGHATDMNIAGNWTNNGSYTHNSGRINFTGITTYSGSSNATLFKAEIKSNSSFKVSSGKTITMDSTLYIRSTDPHNMGQLVMENNSAYLVGGTNNKRVYVEVVDTLHDKYHYISSPIYTGAKGALYNLLGYYVKRYNEPTQLWVSLVGADSLQAGKGYTVKYKDISATSKTITFKEQISKLHNGTISLSISNTAGSNNGGGWNLVGNPYPCAIDWAATNGWNLTNVDPTYYVWDGVYARYATYNKNTSISTNMDNVNRGGQQFIPAMQGFYIFCSDGSPTFSGTGTFSMDNRVRTDQAVYPENRPFWFWKKGAEQNTNPLMSSVFSLKVSGNGYSDESMIGFKSDATGSFDRDYDAYKLISSVENVPQINTTTLDDYKMQVAVNFLPQDYSQKSTVPLQFTVGQAGTYTISSNNALFDPSVMVTLEDVKTGKMTDLQNATYTFKSEAVTNDNRFLIHFGAIAPTSVKEKELNELVTIYTDKNNIVIRNTSNVNEKGLITIYDMLGKEVSSRELIPNSLTSIEMNDKAQSVYFVRIMTDNKCLTKKVCITR